MLKHSPQNSASFDICLTVLEEIFTIKIFKLKNVKKPEKTLSDRITYIIVLFLFDTT